MGSAKIRYRRRRRANQRFRQLEAQARGVVFLGYTLVGVRSPSGAITARFTGRVEAEGGHIYLRNIGGPEGPYALFDYLRQHMHDDGPGTSYLQLDLHIMTHIEGLGFHTKRHPPYPVAPVHAVRVWDEMQVTIGPVS